MQWSERFQTAANLLAKGQVGTVSGLALRTLLPIGNPVLYGGHFFICRLTKLRDLPLKLHLSGGLANSSDLENLGRLYPDEKRFLADRLNHGHTCLVVKNGEEIAASVWCIKNPSKFRTSFFWEFDPEEESATWCHNARVEPRYRMGGGFLALMRSLTAHAERTEGFPLYGAIEAHNEASMRSHRTAGWEFTHEVRHFSLFGLKVFSAKMPMGRKQIEMDYALQIQDRHLH